MIWLERHLHPDGFTCPQCGSSKHCNTCEGAGAALRRYLRAFRGVHKAYLHLYVASYEALLNAKQVTAALIRRMCFGDPSPSRIGT